MTLPTTRRTTHRRATALTLGTACALGLLLVPTTAVSSAAAATTVRSAAVAAAAPVNLTPPSIQGWPIEVDREATADPGTWDASDATFTYQWRAEGSDISGATGPSFTPTFDMIGEQLTVAVTASSGGLTSEPVVSAPVTIDQPSLTPVTFPEITGDARPGGRLTGTPPTYDADGVTMDLQWYRDDIAIDGETAATYDVVAGDVGHAIGFSAWSTAPDHYPNFAIANSVVVQQGTLTARTAPRVTGTPLVGRRLGVVPGTWSASGVPVSYRWTIDGGVVAGATGATFLVPASAAGHRVGVVETTGGPAYESATQQSAGVLVKAPSSVRVAVAQTKPHHGPRRVRVTVKVAAAVPAAGSVRVTVGRVVRTAVLHGGRATVTVRVVRPGRVRVAAAYAGSGSVTAARTARTVRIK